MNPFGNPIDQLLSVVRASMTSNAADQLEKWSDAYGRDLLNLRLLPPDIILSPEECAILADLEREPLSGAAFTHPSLVVILKATRLCNLRCSYCNSWRAGPGHVMDFSTMARLTRSALASPGLRKLQIVWHGGEVTLLPISYVRKALWLQERYRSPHTEVANCIQTNGTRLTPEWTSFLKTYRISVGVSVDASPGLHDQRRRTKGGRGTWDATMQGMALLREAGVPHGVLAVVDEHALAVGAAKFLEYLDALDVRGVALLNALPANDEDSPNADAYLDWNAFLGFLRSTFDIWWRAYRDRFEIRELQALVDAVEGRSHGLCIYAGNCMGRYLTVEPDGSVSACEKYVGNPDYEFGSLTRQEIPELLANAPQLADAIAVVDLQKERAARSCEYFKYCQGGCPHDDLNNRRFGKSGGQCCGMRPLIDDIIHAVAKKEKDDGFAGTGTNAPGFDLVTGSQQLAG